MRMGMSGREYGSVRVLVRASKRERERENETSMMPVTTYSQESARLRETIRLARAMRE